MNVQRRPHRRITVWPSGFRRSHHGLLWKIASPGNTKTPNAVDQNWLATCVHASARARRLNFHQRDEANFRLPGRKLGEEAAEAQRVFAQRGEGHSSPAVAE